MATRTITGTLHDWQGNALNAKTVQFIPQERFFSDGAYVYPRQPITATTDSSGAFSVTVKVPDTAGEEVRYLYVDPIKPEDTFEFPLGQGASIDLSTLMAAYAIQYEETTVSLQAYLDTQNKWLSLPSRVYAARVTKASGQDPVAEVVKNTTGLTATWEAAGNLGQLTFSADLLESPANYVFIVMPSAISADIVTVERSSATQVLLIVVNTSAIQVEDWTVSFKIEIYD